MKFFHFFSSLIKAKFDGSWKKFQGVMESWRLQTEYRIVAQHHKMKRNLTDMPLVTKNPSFSDPLRGRSSRLAALTNHAK